MKFDDDVRVKDGRKVIVVHLSATDQIFTETIKTMEKALEL